MTKGVRAIRAEASPHGHDVSPVPAPRTATGASSAPSVRRPWPRACASLRVLERAGRASSAASARHRSPPRAVAGRGPVRIPDSPTPPSTSPRRSSPRRAPSKASASRSRCSSPTSRARWSCWPTATPRRPASSSIPVLERMMEAVHRYEGTVNQVMGDGIMALFGAPLAHEDHAVRACYAALDMQAAMRRYAEEVRRAHGVEVQIRVGLNSGEVVVRAIGSDLRMDYTAVGQTTHLAARMEQLATPGHHPADRRHAAAGGRLRRGEAARAGAGEGAGGARRGLRADRRRAPALAAPRGGRARADPLRRARGRAGAAPPGARRAPRRPRPGRGDRRRARRGQVAPGLGGHPLAPRPRLARPPGRLGLVRQGDVLSAGDRSPQGLLRDRGPRRPARGAARR